MQNNYLIQSLQLTYSILNLVRTFFHMPKKCNVFSNVSDASKDEIFEKLVCSNNSLVERITSFGQSTPKGKWLKQTKNEWVILLSGSATLVFMGQKPLRLKPDDYVFIPAGCKHRVHSTSKSQRSIWIAFHFD